jgi:hypothetical protein
VARSLILAGPEDAATAFSSRDYRTLVDTTIPQGATFDGELGIVGDGTSVYRITLGRSSVFTLQPLLAISFPIRGFSGTKRILIESKSDGSTSVFPFAYLSGVLAYSSYGAGGGQVPY